MNIYELAARHSTPDEMAKLIADMAEESRLLRAGWYAAKAFIEASVSEDPPEDADGLYDAYIEAGRKL
jgi:hypothetical protein